MTKDFTSLECGFLIALFINLAIGVDMIRIKETSVTKLDTNLAELNVRETQEKRNAAVQLISIMQILGVKYPRVVLSQMIVETGWFDSRLCKENNNYWGMKRTNREFLINKDSLGNQIPKDCACFDWKLHACYKSIEDGFKDFIVWQSLVLEGYRRSHGHYPRDDYEYIEMLNCLRFPSGISSFGTCRRYAEDPVYTETVTSILDTKVYKYVKDHALAQ